MRRAFLEHLIAEGVISEPDAQRTRDSMRNPAEPIGSIAQRCGLLTSADIDIVLERQQDRHRPFGEIAVDLGILTINQLDNLLFLQRFRQILDVTEAAVIGGCCSRQDAAEQAARFLPQTDTASLIARERVWSIVADESE